VGISDGLRGTSRSHYNLLHSLDILLTAFVMSPAVVGYWRGTWNLMDAYVFPKHPTISCLTSLILGFTGHIVFTMVQADPNPISRYMHQFGDPLFIQQRLKTDLYLRGELKKKVLLLTRHGLI